MRGFRWSRLALVVLSITALPMLAAAKPQAPKTAPTFHLPALAGSASLDSLRGQVVLVDFWASWCAPCLRSFPWMDSLVTRYGNQGFHVVAINLDKDRALADRFLEGHPPSFTIAYDPAGKTAEAYGVAAMPTSFLIGRTGTIVQTHVGFDPKKNAAFEHEIAEQVKP
jgi:thiol-disulfide isomerase/thioredoxin